MIAETVPDDAAVNLPCASTVMLAKVYEPAVTAVSESFAAVTASSAIFAVTTWFAEILAEVTALSAILTVVTALADN